MIFLVASICIGNFLHANEFYYLPESGAICIMGVAFGALLNIVAESIDGMVELTDMTEFGANWCISSAVHLRVSNHACVA